MNRFRLNLRLSAFICGSLLCDSVSAAPPAITYLYPAGAQRGTAVEVTAAGTFDASTKVWASGKGVSVEAAKDKGKFKVTVAKDAVPGTYWLRAYNDEGASGLRPFIVGTLPEVTEKEPNDDFKKPHVLDSSSAVVNGKLEKSGDVDCFAVQLKKGQTLVASLEANRTLRSPMDAMLQVLSADGFVLEENSDFHGLDPQIAFTAKKDGTYIARVYAFPAAPDASIRYFGSDACVYRLTLTTGAFADFSVPLAYNARGILEKLDVRGWNIPPDLTGFESRKTGDFDTHQVFTHEAFANPVRVRLEWHKCFELPDPKSGIVNRFPALQFSVTSRIPKGGGATTIDFLSQKGVAASIQVESRSFGLGVNPVVRILDKDKKQVARAEPTKLNGDTALSFTPPTDDPYTIEVSDLYGGGGGPRDYFLLRILTAKPEFDFNATTDRFTIPAGQPTTLILKVNRKNGFDKPVDRITSEGLPAGVKLEATKPAKPDPNTVTLSLTAEKPWAGSFRLFGENKNDPPSIRPLRVALPDFDETTDDLWLTVTPAKK